MFFFFYFLRRKLSILVRTDISDISGRIRCRNILRFRLPFRRIFTYTAGRRGISENRESGEISGGEREKVARERRALRVTIVKMVSVTLVRRFSCVRAMRARARSRRVTFRVILIYKAYRLGAPSFHHRCVDKRRLKHGSGAPSSDAFRCDYALNGIKARSLARYRERAI